MLSGSPARRSGPDSGTDPYADRIRAQVAQDAGDLLLGGGGSIRRAATICSKTPLPPVASPGPGGCRPRAGRATAAWSAGLHRVVLARRASRRRLSGIPDPGAPGSARQRSSVARPPAEPPTQQRRGPSPGASRSSAHHLSSTVICTTVAPEAAPTPRRQGLIPVHIRAPSTSRQTHTTAIPTKIAAGPPTTRQGVRSQDRQLPIDFAYPLATSPACEQHIRKDFVSYL